MSHMAVAHQLLRSEHMINMIVRSDQLVAD